MEFEMCFCFLIVCMGHTILDYSLEFKEGFTYMYIYVGGDLNMLSTKDYDRPITDQTVLSTNMFLENPYSPVIQNSVLSKIKEGHRQPV